LAEELRSRGLLEDREGAGLPSARPSPYHGRGQPWMLDLADARAVVVKSLRHGGLLARWTRDWFWGRRRLDTVRRLLQHLEERQVPTALWVFDRSRRSRRLPLLRRLELATLEVAGSRDLRAVLEDRPRKEQRRVLAVQLGKLVRRLHDAGVQHADLNLKNVLVVGAESPSLSIIDLEGSQLHSVLSKSRAVANLERLRRSLEKLGFFPGTVGVHELLAFLRAYEPDVRRRRELRAATLKRLRWRGPWHRLSWKLQGGRRRNSEH
jgi:3-deoxy-D-manno-octulosonic acid kinase